MIKLIEQTFKHISLSDEFINYVQAVNKLNSDEEYQALVKIENKDSDTKFKIVNMEKEMRRYEKEINQLINHIAKQCQEKL